MQPARNTILRSIPRPVVSPRATSSAATAAPAAKKTVTPQGLLAEIDPANNYRLNRISLARSPDTPDHYLALNGIGGDDGLVAAFQSNSPFVVMSRLPSGVTIDGDLGMAGWTFAVGFASGPALSMPLVVFKYRNGAAIADLARDTDLWSKGDWSANPAADQTHLLAYIQTVDDAYTLEASQLRGHSLFHDIHEKLHDPSWNGMLAVNMPLNYQSLPSELQPLVIGVDPARFILNHVGVTASKYSQTAGDDLSLDRSSLFALVDYVDGRDPDVPSDFGFHAVKLQALFSQSRLTQFAGLVRFKVARMFKQDYTQSEKIELIGSYEKHDGVDTYSFATMEPVPFQFEDCLVESVTIERAQFTGDSTADTLTAKFTMSANLTLGQSAVAQTITKYFCLEGLSCKNLVVQFSACKSDPTKLVAGSGKFQPGLLTFDFTGVKSCGSSLLTLFPIEFEKFFAGLDDASFPDLGSIGFFPLRPGSGPFDFGFSFRLALGGLGGLVSGAKKLDAELMLGWQAPLKGVVVGFRLPGGSLDLGIQGVLKLHVGDFQLYEDSGPAPYYAVLLQDCRLTLLGLTLPKNDSSCDIAIVPNPAKPLSSPVGWFGGVQPDDADDDDYWGLGQRIAIQPNDGTPLTFDNILDLLRDFVTQFIHAIHDTDHQVAIKDFLSGQQPGAKGKLVYDASNDWTVAFNYTVPGVVTLGAVFNDPTLYGMRVKILPDVFTLGIVYRKISDELGEYSTEIRLPDALRQIEVGAASLTLPIIGLDLYTNGDFRVDLGFPWQLDFSRSFSLQILPFLGSGGFYVGKLHGGSTDLIPAAPNAVIAVFGFGLRVGLGKEIEKGVLAQPERLLVRDPGRRGGLPG